MRTARKSTSYDFQFQQEAVALVHRSDRSIPELARSLGVAKPTLYRWYNRDMAKKRKPVATGAQRAGVADETAEEKVMRLEAENAALRKRVDSLEEDKEILKKFAAFSVREKT
jgi:transposase-like protein